MKLSYLTLVNELPREELHCTIDEFLSMGIRLKDESAYITDYIKRGANEEFKFNCLRINLACTLPPIRDGIRKFESVHEIDVPFSLDYFSMSPKQKEKYLIDVTENGLRRFCDAADWDFSVFQKHIDALRSNSSRVEFNIPKKPCRNGQLSAKVYCVQNMTETIYFMDFFFKRTRIQRKFFAVSKTDAFFYRSNIYHMEWSDDKTVSVYQYAAHQLYARVSLDADVPQSKCEPSDSHIEVCEKQIQRVYRIKTAACSAIGIDPYDCSIDAWEENPNGSVFVILSLYEKGPHRYFAMVDRSGAVVTEFCENYLDNEELADVFKKQNGWFDK